MLFFKIFAWSWVFFYIIDMGLLHEGFKNSIKYAKNEIKNHTLYYIILFLLWIFFSISIYYISNGVLSIIYYIIYGLMISFGLHCGVYYERFMK